MGGGGGELYDHFMNTRISTFIMNGIYKSYKIYEESGYGHGLDVLTVVY